MAINDEDLLQIVRDEKTRSLGFDGTTEGSSELQSQRETALNYYNGKMSDIPFLENTSEQVDSSVSDAIEQTIPNLVEIFLDEDVAAFRPMNENDIEQAAQETDYVNHVVMNQNNGFELFNTVFKDALLLKTGVFYWYWEAGLTPKEEVFKGQTMLDVENVLKTGADQIVDGLQGITIEEGEDGDEPTFTWKMQPKKHEGKVCIKAWAPDDIAVSEDTVKLGEGTYCGFRSRVRKQDLLEDGYSEDVVMELPSYSNTQAGIQTARDTVADTQYLSGSTNSDTLMDMVQIYYNYVRVWDGDEKKLFLVVTAGEDQSILLKTEEVSRVPASAITPFPVPHRFYGRSMADMLIEIQRIKTSLLRVMLNSAYFAQNQRYQVAQSGVTKWTFSDILNNSPGAPVRVKEIGTVAPIPNGGLGFDPFAAMEAIDTMAEKRSGVARNMQGLNPDTLHETAGGALAQMNNAAIRIRYIARIFAETGVRDMFLGVHDLLRQNSTIPQITRLRGKFVPINPSSWSLREDMDIEIGNAGGREYDLMVMDRISNVQQKLVEAQQGIDGPLTDPSKILATARRMIARMGIKDTDTFIKNPDLEQAPPPGAEQPDPAVQEAQMKQQADIAKFQATMQQNQAEAQQKMELEMQKLQLEHSTTQAQFQLEIQKFQAEMQFKREQMLRNTELEQQSLAMKYGSRADQVDQELNLKREIAATEAELEAARIKSQDENEKLSILAEQEDADADRKHQLLQSLLEPISIPHPPKADLNIDVVSDSDPINLPNVFPGGEPG